MENKIDWSQYEIKEDNQKPMDWSQFESKENNGDDEEEFPIPEFTGLSGIGADLLSAALGAKDFAMDIPNKLEKSGKYIEEHPGQSILHNLGQIAASTGNIGKGFVNAPYNLNQYLARKHLLPEVLGKLGKKIIPHLPEDMGIEHALGLEPDTEKGDELYRAIPELATALSGGRALASQGKRVLKAPDLKQSIRETQAKVNAATEKSGKIFDEIENTLEKKGKNIVEVNPELIDKAKSMLSKKFKNIIQQARTGDYKALRRLQAALGAKERKGLASKNLGDIDQAENIGVIRDDINQTIQKHLEVNGFEDLAKALNKNRGDYAAIQKTYFSTPQLAKVFGKSQKVPAKPMTLLSEESAEMKKFMAAHPEVKEALTKALKHESKMKKIKGFGSMLGIGTTAEIAREILGRK